jgi:cell division septation protein DedD
MAANAAKSKYAALDRTEPAQPDPVEVPSQEKVAVRPPATPRPVGRPSTGVAKSKDPNMKAFTILLNIDTHADANAILKKARTEGDMSDLVQRLLSEWVKEKKA